MWLELSWCFCPLECVIQSDQQADDSNAFSGCEVEVSGLVGSLGAEDWARPQLSYCTLLLSLMMYLIVKVSPTLLPHWVSGSIYSRANKYFMIIDVDGCQL